MRLAPPVAVLATLATACLLVVAVPSASATTGPFGLQAMDTTGWQDLPYLDSQVITGSFSSYDRNDSNDDGFRGNGYLYSESYAGGTEQVIADIRGPGEITRMVFAGKWPTSTRIRIYLDGSSSASDYAFSTFFAGTNGPFSAPLVVPEPQSAGSFSSYLPLTFSSGIKIAVTPAPTSGAVYNVEYRRYPAGTSISTFDPSSSSQPNESDVLSLWNALGSSPTRFTDDDDPRTGTLDLPSNGVEQIYSSSGAGEITSLKLSVPGLPGDTTDAYAEDVLDNIWIRVTWDGDSTPSIDAPIGSFFGVGLYGDANPPRALPFGIDSSGDLYTYFPMPFRSGAKIELYSNRSVDTSGIGYTIVDRPFTGSFANVGELHTQFRFSRMRATDPFDYVALSAVGSGKFVGLETSGSGSWLHDDGTDTYADQAIHWLEGDEHVYVDGSQTPQWNGSGTEDYFGGAGYFCCSNGNIGGPADLAGFSYFSNALNGFTAHEFPTPSSTQIDPQTGNMAMYRAQPSDGIEFRNSIRISFEHGGGIRTPNPPSSDVPMNSDFLTQNAEVWTLAFYYYKPIATSSLSDTLAIGTSDESSHSYSTSPTTSATSATHAYEGQLDAIASQLDERTIPAGGSSQFTLTVDSSNQGVILRRTFDQSTASQAADVYVQVDGTFSLVGPWFYPGANSTFAWRDDDFFIPASFSNNGTTHMTVKIVDTGSNGWNEARYQAFSVASGTSVTQPPITDGATFQISSLVSHLPLDIDGQTADGSGVTQEVSAVSADGQLWRAIQLPGTNTYAFVDVDAGRVLAGSAGEQAVISTWTGASNQMWQLTAAPTTGYYIVKNVGTGDVLDVVGASTDAGVHVQQYTENDSTAQQWRFEQQAVRPTRFPTTYGTPATAAPLESGATYALTSRVGGFDLDLIYGSATPGQRVQQWNPNPSCAQKWLFTAVGTNVYTIRTTCPSSQTLVLQTPASGTQLELGVLSGSNGSASQQWRVELVKDGVTDTYYRLVNVGNGNAMDVCNNGSSGCTGTVAGAAVQSYAWDATTSQLWRLQIQEASPSCPSSGCGRWYELSPLSDTGLNLDVQYASANAGAGVQVYTANHTCAQEWRADYVAGGYYKLTNLCSDKVLGVQDASTSASASLQIWTWNGTDAELWQIDAATTSGYYTLTNKGSGLQLTAGSSGSLVTQQSGTGTSAQQWSLTSGSTHETDLALTGVPADLTVAATSPAGAVVTYTPPTVVGEDAPLPPVTCDHQPGSTFPIGTTTVTCTAADPDDPDRPVSASFTVTVNDTDLALTGTPTDLTVDATSPAGAVVSYTPPTVVDEDVPLPPVTCDHQPGSTFPIGTTTVTCTVSDPDDSNSPVSASFTVTVVGAAGQLHQLAQAVVGVGSGRSLASKIQSALADLAAGDVAGAKGDLGAFRHEVKAQTGKKISRARSAQLIAQAQQIIATLG